MCKVRALCEYLRLGFLETASEVLEHVECLLRSALGINAYERGGKEAGLGRGRRQAAIDPTTASPNSIGSSGVGRLL